MRLGTRDVSGRPQLSAAAGAKSPEEPGQERPRAGLKREHGSDEPFGRTRYDSKSPARLARREAKSELAQIRVHHGFVLATRSARVNLGMSALGVNPGHPAQKKKVRVSPKRPFPGPRCAPPTDGLLCAAFLPFRTALGMVSSSPEAVFPAPL